MLLHVQRQGWGVHWLVSACVVNAACLWVRSMCLPARDRQACLPASPPAQSACLPAVEWGQPGAHTTPCCSHAPLPCPCRSWGPADGGTCKLKNGAVADYLAAASLVTLKDSGIVSGYLNPSGEQAILATEDSAAYASCPSNHVISEVVGAWYAALSGSIDVKRCARCAVKLLLLRRRCRQGVGVVLLLGRARCLWAAATVCIHRPAAAAAAA